jgi:high-affinity K+ transport system ATPase subunit B
MVNFLLAIPARLKLWLAAIVGAFAVVFAAYAKGRADAKAKRKATEAAAKIKTLETAREVKADVDEKSVADVRDALGKWVRRD